MSEAVLVSIGTALVAAEATTVGFFLLAHAAALSAGTPILEGVMLIEREANDEPS